MKLVAATCLIACLCGCGPHVDYAKQQANEYVARERAKFAAEHAAKYAQDEKDATEAAKTAAWVAEYRKTHPLTVEQQQLADGELESWKAQEATMLEATKQCLAAVNTDAGVLACTR